MQTPTAQAISNKTLYEMYTFMLTAREMDLIEQSYTGRGEAFFHVSGAGHEASAAIIPHLKAEDYLHCHYRDKALMLARGISPYSFFLSLFNKDGSQSRGRQMNAHMSSREHNVISMAGPVGNSLLQSVGVAETLKQANKGITLCSMGEGTTQEAEVMEGIIYAGTESLPIIFLIQDNAYAISTKTKGKVFYNYLQDQQFLNIPVHHIDGRNVLNAYTSFEKIVSDCRKDVHPQIIVFSVERLHSHTNADDHNLYRSKNSISTIQKNDDPLIHAYNALIERGYDPTELEDLQQSIYKDLYAQSKLAQQSAEPDPVQVVARDIAPKLLDPANEYRGDAAKKELTMLEALRNVLDYHLSIDDHVTLFGEDLEDPKGDVFGVTKGLSTKYGTDRVTNSPLNEALIVGASIGRALAGNHPVAFLQFADFLPVAFNQLFCELGSIYWRADGSWQAPVIVMVSSGGYRPGLGPFHAASMESITAHIPGVDVYMPSTAGDAAGMLNTAFASKRPTLFFYPKTQLNNVDIATSADVEKHLIPIGKARLVREGNHISFIAYGNTVSLCEKAAAVLEEQGIESDIIDLRYIVPWDKDAVLRSAQKTGRAVIVHEDSHTVGFGAEIAATIAEHSNDYIIVRRVTRADTFVPCHFPSQLEVLPSFKRILTVAVETLDGAISWKQNVQHQAHEFIIEAIGSSPSDESITVINWLVKEGDLVHEGQHIAELEADKATVELKSSVEGKIVQLYAEEGDTFGVGDPLVRVELSDAVAKTTYQKPITRENPGQPVIQIDEIPRPFQSTQSKDDVDLSPNILTVQGRTGSRKVTNAEIVQYLSGEWDEQAIIRRSGIEERYWVGEGESALSMATQVAQQALDDAKFSLHEIDGIVCSTGTPLYHTPSMAALIQAQLAKDLDAEYFGFSYDISAACSGYLYGLHAAYTYLTHHPEANILLVTTEELSSHINLKDKSTAPIFGDAATATIIAGKKSPRRGRMRLRLPQLSAVGDVNGDLLKVPGNNKNTSGYITMHGGKVYQAAIKNMIRMLKRACVQEKITPEDLDLIVPHQANQRIIDAIRTRLKLPIEKLYSNVRFLGNTSSNTIPLCLIDILKKKTKKMKLGLVAFGGGFTFGSAIIELN